MSREEREPRLKIEPTGEGKKASRDKKLEGEKTETDVVAVAWNKLTHRLALETDPQKMESAKQELLKIIEENKKRNPMERIDNENYFARDLMEWIKDRGAEGEAKKAEYIFEIMKEIVKGKGFLESRSDYACNCYETTEKVMAEFLDELGIEKRKKMSDISKSVYERMERSKK